MDLNQLTGWWVGLTNRQQIAVGVVIILVAYMVFKTLGGSFRSNQRTIGNQAPITISDLSSYRRTNWKNQDPPNMNPVDTLLKLVQTLGEPAIFDGQSGGLAVWNKSQLTQLNLPFERVEIRDEQITHQSPAPHIDFLYTTYQIGSVTNHKVDGFIRINKSISFDANNQSVTVRCQDLRANVVGLWIVKQYIDDRLTLDEAAGMHGPMVMELLQDDETGVKYEQLLSEL